MSRVGHRLDPALRLGVELIVCIRHGSWFDRGKLRTLARRLSFDAATQRAHNTTTLLAGVADADRMIADAKRHERRTKRRMGWTLVFGPVLGPIVSWLHDLFTGDD